MDPHACSRRDCVLRTTHFLKLLHLVVVEPDQGRIFQAPHLSKVQHFQISTETAHGQDSWRAQGGWYAYNSPQAQPSKASTTPRERRNGSVGHCAPATATDRSDDSVSRYACLPSFCIVLFRINVAVEIDFEGRLSCRVWAGTPALICTTIAAVPHWMLFPTADPTPTSLVYLILRVSPDVYYPLCASYYNANSRWGTRTKHAKTMYVMSSLPPLLMILRGTLDGGQADALLWTLFWTTQRHYPVAEFIYSIPRASIERENESKCQQNVLRICTPAKLTPTFLTRIAVTLCFPPAAQPHPFPRRE